MTTKWLNPDPCFSGRAGFSNLDSSNGGWFQNPMLTVLQIRSWPPVILHVSVLPLKEEPSSLGTKRLPSPSITLLYGRTSELRKWFRTSTRLFLQWYVSIVLSNLNLLYIAIDPKKTRPAFVLRCRVWGESVKFCIFSRECHVSWWAAYSNYNPKWFQCGKLPSM